MRMGEGANLHPNQLYKMDAWRRAANYLSVGRATFWITPFLKEPLKKEDLKPRLLGHWGTTPGLNFIYVHLNRVIKERDLDIIYIIIGPGHGGPGIVANAYLEGAYSEVYPNISQDEEGMQKQFSFPGASAAFAATVEPRYSARLAFRVLGRVIERNVNTGDSVKKGARLAALDPVPFELAVRDARAGPRQRRGAACQRGGDRKAPPHSPRGDAEQLQASL